MHLCIDRLWDGSAAHERYSLDLGVDDATHELVVNVDAPYFADPAPSVAPGSVPDLYEYEVVELFLFGTGARYLELELGPHGHYLALTFEGLRQRREHLSIAYDVPVLANGRWRGTARIPPGALPPAASLVNAHAIHGHAPRRWLSAGPARCGANSRPDFHRLDTAVGLEPELVRKLERAYKSLEAPG